MNTRSHSHRFVVGALLLTLAACGGGGDDSAPPAPPPAPPPSSPPPPGILIGAAGGTVTGLNGAQVVIPAGALATEIRINIEQIVTGAPALPAGFAAHGQMFAFTPHGTTFAAPVTMTLPFDPASVPAGTTPVFYKTTNAQTQWEQIANATFGATTVSAQVTSFSNATVVIPPLTVGDPIRVWSFREFRGDALEEVELDSGTQFGGELEEIYDFGGAFFDPEMLLEDGTVAASDNIASGFIYSSPSGVTYYVEAQAPLGNAAIPEDPIGSEARLVQYQTYTKNSADATYRFTLSSAFIEVYDGNGSLHRACPDTHDLIGLACDLIKGTIYLDVKAYKDADVPGVPKVIFYRVAGGALLNGSAGAWLAHAWPANSSRAPLWNSQDFSIDHEPFRGGPDGHLLMELINPRTYHVNLSSVDVGESFTVLVETYASTYNRAAGAVSGQDAEFETAVNTWLRDPATIGGTTVTTTGLTPIATPLPLVEPVEPVAEPAPCVPGPGPDPAAGLIQFSAATFTQAEASTTPTIAVSRTGGSVGAVTATFSTGGGTAVAGVDYTATASTIYFADGDAAERNVELPIIQDLLSAERDKTVNLTLSQPGGCAALGSRTTAVLTIRDDDVPPPPTLFTVGGTVTGYTGAGLVLENHIGLFLPIAGNGPFTFSNIPSPSGTAYLVRVFNQPHNGSFQTQACTVANGTGIFGNANVTNVVVTCESL